jgi:hypothetical protein
MAGVRDGRARSRNVSFSGMFVETTLPLRSGATLNLRFFVPGSPEAIELEAEVRWIGQEGCGVRFTRALRGKQAWHLNRLVF